MTGRNTEKAGGVSGLRVRFHDFHDQHWRSVLKQVRPSPCLCLCFLFLFPLVFSFHFFSSRISFPCACDREYNAFDFSQWQKNRFQVKVEAVLAGGVAIRDRFPDVPQATIAERPRVWPGPATPQRLALAEDTSCVGDWVGEHRWRSVALHERGLTVTEKLKRPLCPLWARPQL